MDRLQAMQEEIKRRKENLGVPSVEIALGQVRALALRASTHNSALVAAQGNIGRHTVSSLTQRARPLYSDLKNGQEKWLCGAIAYPHHQVVGDGCC